MDAVMIMALAFSLVPTVFKSQLQCGCDIHLPCMQRFSESVACPGKLDKSIIRVILLDTVPYNNKYTYTCNVVF